MWYLISLVSPTLASADAIRVTVEYPHEMTCQRALVDNAAKRRREFDKQGRIVLWETCVRQEKQVLAQNTH
jgi:hypothetical protein